MMSSLESRKVLSGSPSSRWETKLAGSLVIWSVMLLAALDSQVDLHPLLILLDDAVIFAQGMALPAVGQQDALHVGMAVEGDTEHVEDFPFQPVGRRPDGDRTGEAGPVGDVGLHADTFVA